LWSANGVAARVEELQRLLAPVVAALGFEMWGIELSTRPRHSLLRIYIDGPEGITVDDCAAVSRQVSATLDVADPIQGAYTLEVSSPGLDRPLFHPEQFERFAGQRVKVALAHLVSGRRNLAGVLASVDADGIVVALGEEQSMRVPWGSIRRANLVVEGD
jgi:ribosome maturation factor RimP